LISGAALVGSGNAIVNVLMTSVPAMGAAAAGWPYFTGSL
jgi:hypothetical protein